MPFPTRNKGIFEKPHEPTFMEKDMQHIKSVYIQFFPFIFVATNKFLIPKVSKICEVTS